MSTYRLQPVAILWDIENCAVPRGVNPEDVAVHVRMALKVQLALRGPITVFSAYGNFSHLSPRIRQGCQKTGVNLIDIPLGSKDAADKAILVDMFLFALDNPPPCTVVLISGDVDFAPALHKLGQRGYCVVLAIPTGLYVSPALRNACQYLWSWPDVARGKSLTSGKTPITCDCKPSETVGLNAGSVRIDLAKGNDYPKSNFIDGVEGNHHGFDTLEAGPSSMKNAWEVPRKLPAGMFEEYVKVPLCIIKEFTKIPVVMEVDRNINRSVFPSSCGSVFPDDVAPLTSQAMNHEFVAPYPAGTSCADVVGEVELGRIWKGLAHCNAGMHDDAGTTNIGSLFNMGYVVANRPAKSAWAVVRGRDTNPSFQPHSRNAWKRFANFKRGKSARNHVAGAKGQNPSLLSKVKKKEEMKNELWPHPKKLRRSARLAARRARGM